MRHYHVDLMDRQVLSSAFDTVKDADNYAKRLGSVDYYVFSCRMVCRDVDGMIRQTTKSK